VPGFNQTPRVINGCSDLLVEVFGEEIGRHARSAVVVADLRIEQWNGLGYYPHLVESDRFFDLLTEFEEEIAPR
jgi:hypothetical protein